MPQPVDGGLEPIGLSFGSMMSMGTATGTAAAEAAAAADGGKLEGAGLSFGSTMSYSVAAAPGTATGHARQGSFGGHQGAPAVDGGLQEIGTSFGSLSLAEGERERIIAEAEREMMLDSERAGAVPTLLQQQKSKGNLLECSDTESEEEEATDTSAQKSAEWGKLQATLAAQEQSMRTTHTTAAMPPPLFGGRGGGSHPVPEATLNIPTAGLDREFSQMSAMSFGDDFAPAPVAYSDFVVPTAIHGGTGHYDAGQGFHSDMPPPPPEMKKGLSDDWKDGDQVLEFTYLNRGNSLASETFSEPPES